MSAAPEFRERLPRTSWVLRRALLPLSERSHVRDQRRVFVLANDAVPRGHGDPGSGAFGMPDVRDQLGVGGVPRHLPAKVPTALARVAVAAVAAVRVVDPPAGEARF